MTDESLCWLTIPAIYFLGSVATILQLLPTRVDLSGE